MDHEECEERKVTPALRAIASPARIARASRLLAKASRLREIFPGSSPAEKDRFGETPKPTPETGALPGHLNALQKSPPEDYGKEDQTTVAAFLPWRGSLVLSP